MTEKLQNPFEITELINTVNDIIDDKQDTLVSGTNIKTINNESILGSGNITIEGGSDAIWGAITGTLSDQTDLQTALNAKAADNAVVHKTSNETITGVKTFTSNVKVSKAAPYVDLYNTNITKGTIPSSVQVARNAMTDKDGKYIAMTQYQYNTAGETQAVLRAYNPNNENDFAQISIWYPHTGDPYTYAPTPATLDNSTKIATTAWVNNLDNSVVHKTGDETISGIKTFQGDGWIAKIQNIDVTYNIAPSSNKGTSIIFTDKNGTQMGCVECFKLNDNSTMTRLNTYGPNDNWSSQPLTLRVFSDGYSVAYAPTPYVNAYGNEIATAAYINTKFQVVSALPASPNPDTYYFIPES